MTLSTVAALPRGSRNELMTSSTSIPPGRLDTSDQQSLSSRSDPVVCLGREDIVSSSVPDPGAVHQSRYVSAHALSPPA